MLNVGRRRRHALRVLKVALVHPVEIADRIRNRLELREERKYEPSLSQIPPRNDWSAAVHALLAAKPTQACRQGFRDVWSAIEREAGRMGYGHDADVRLCQCLYCIVTHSSAKRVLETGVARGVSSRVILEAFKKTGQEGHLWSIDLPPLLEGWHDLAGTAVPQELSGNWTYIRGSSRRRLDPLLSSLDDLDVFVHDSLHTNSTVLFELEHAWTHLRKSGIVLIDDVDDNEAVQLFTSIHPECEVIVVDHQVKEGRFAVLRKDG
jgi:hypothetical protein